MASLTAGIGSVLSSASAVGESGELGITRQSARFGGGPSATSGWCDPTGSSGRRPSALSGRRPVFLGRCRPPAFLGRCDTSALGGRCNASMFISRCDCTAAWVACWAFGWSAGFLRAADTSARKRSSTSSGSTGGEPRTWAFGMFVAPGTRRDSGGRRSSPTRHSPWGVADRTTPSPNNGATHSNCRRSRMKSFRELFADAGAPAMYMGP